ncbi:hypothetical protein [Nocardioides lijunqiniae]|uniref:hypothetical protein n=1 Tax=Nocardioides lijunqiniae TaxID=2760832 RepID=UPI001878FB38|nr:hypothetical protein [Nocardioides lijunqiniae]
MAGRCPAPARTEWGTLRCVVTVDGCNDRGHARWRRVAWLMALVWRLRPWWPNAKGRAADRAGRGPADRAGRARALSTELYRTDRGRAA